MSSTNPMDGKENIDDSESIASDESLDEIAGKFILHCSHIHSIVLWCYISWFLDYDEFEFDHRRAQCVSDMKELEIQFSRLKEQLIYERNNLIDKKLKEIEDENAEEFVVPLKKLEMNMDFKIKLTSKLFCFWKTSPVSKPVVNGSLIYMFVYTKAICRDGKIFLEWAFLV